MCLRYYLFFPYEERQRYESSDIKVVWRVFGPKRCVLGGALCDNKFLEFDMGGACTTHGDKWSVTYGFL
jgi:hypothetical protein